MLCTGSCVPLAWLCACLCQLPFRVPHPLRDANGDQRVTTIDRDSILTNDPSKVDSSQPQPAARPRPRRRNEYDFSDDDDGRQVEGEAVDSDDEDEEVVMREQHATPEWLRGVDVCGFDTSAMEPTVDVALSNSFETRRGVLGTAAFRYFCR